MSNDLATQCQRSLVMVPLLLVTPRQSHLTCLLMRMNFDSFPSRYFSQNNSRCSIPFSKDYRSHPMTQRLWRLHRILQVLASLYALNWVGLFLSHARSGLHRMGTCQGKLYRRCFTACHPSQSRLGRNKQLCLELHVWKNPILPRFTPICTLLSLTEE